MYQVSAIFTTFVFLSFLWTICTARIISKGATIEKVQNTESFSLDAVHVKSRSRNFAASLKKAYGRYGITPTLPVSGGSTDEKKTSLRRRKDGTLTTTSYGGDSEYISVLSIGGQKMRVAPDTGSADLWVFSDTLPSTQSYTGHRMYSSSKSKTFSSMSGSSWYITYADGTYAGGTVGMDTVKAGSTSVANQPFGMAETVSDGYVSDTNVDGIMGLSFSTINTVRPTQVQTFFEAAIPTLKKAIFCVVLKHQASGSYDFGYIDSKKYTGTIKYVKVYQDTGYWQVYNTAWQVGTGAKTTESGTYGILDTGTSLLLLSDAAVSAYYAQVSGATYDSSQAAYTFPCASTLPDFSIQLGSGSSKLWLKIPGPLMNYGYITSDGLTCYGGLQSRGDSDINIIGDIFFKSFFVVFDKGKSRAGFAAQV